MHIQRFVQSVREESSLLVEPEINPKRVQKTTRSARYSFSMTPKQLCLTRPTDIVIFISTVRFLNTAYIDINQ